MNAHNPSRVPESRALSEPTLHRLREAIAARWRDPARPDAELRQVLGIAAHEARERSLRPEELIVALKALVDSLAGDETHSAVDRARLREWLVTTCVRVYFGRE